MRVAFEAVDGNAELKHMRTYQPIRPPVRWSRVEKRFASRNGGSNDVLAVMPKDKFFVTF